MGGREQVEEDHGDEGGEEEEEEEDIKVMTCSGVSHDLVISETPRHEDKRTLYRFVWTATTSVACSTPQEDEEEEGGLPHPREVSAAAAAAAATAATTIRDPSETEG